MSKENGDSNTAVRNGRGDIPARAWWTFGWVAILMCALWTASYLIIWTYFGDLDAANKFGGIFQSIGALFNGLALAGIVAATFLQKRELEFQRGELTRAAAASERAEAATAKAHNLASILKILEYIDRIDLHESRHFVYRNPECLKNVPSGECTNEELAKLDDILRTTSNEKVSLQATDLWINALNNIGFLVREGYAPTEIISNHMRNTYLHCWEAFGPYIAFRQRRAGESSSVYGCHFEWVIDKIKHGHFKPTLDPYPMPLA